MPEERKVSKEYESIGLEAIKNEPSLQTLRNSACKIIYLLSDKAKTKGGNTVFAQCEKVPDKLQWAINADMLVVIFEPNVENFSREQKYALMHHELLHINVKYSKDGEESYGTRPHDYEDFKEIIDKYGTDWCRT